MLTQVRIENGQITAEVREGNGLGVAHGFEGRDDVDNLVQAARSALRNGQAREIARQADLIGSLQADIRDRIDNTHAILDKKDRVEKERDHYIAEGEKLEKVIEAKNKTIRDLHFALEELKRELRDARDAVEDEYDYKPYWTLAGNVKGKVAQLKTLFERAAGNAQRAEARVRQLEKTVADKNAALDNYEEVPNLRGPIPFHTVLATFMGDSELAVRGPSDALKQIEQWVLSLRRA